MRAAAAFGAAVRLLGCGLPKLAELREAAEQILGVTASDLSPQRLAP
ncbi:hypothetical protein [Paenibacillus mucilaginosus]|nr:hypothetical protein [Paenibacillus mucilaginosus]